MSPALAPAQGAMLARLEALAADLAARGCRGQLVTRPGGVPFLGVAGEPGDPDEQVWVLPRRDGTWAYWRPGPVPVAGSARHAADIIAGPAMPGGHLPAPGTGAGHHLASGGVRPLARETGMPGPRPDPGRRQATAMALARVLPGPVPGILPPAWPGCGRSLARSPGREPTAVPAGPGRP